VLDQYLEPTAHTRAAERSIRIHNGATKVASDFATHRRRKKAQK
jgi:hypothetical protein